MKQIFLNSPSREGDMCGVSCKLYLFKPPSTGNEKSVITLEMKLQVIQYVSCKIIPVYCSQPSPVLLTDQVVK